MNLLRHLANSSSLPWVCLGDSNDLLSSAEKRGNRAHPNWKFNWFCEVVFDAGFVNLGMEGYQFTWERSRGTDAWVEERLDRVFATTAWCNLFPMVKVWSLEATCSDYLPILLDPNPLNFIHRNKRFRFENF